MTKLFSMKSLAFAGAAAFALTLAAAPQAQAADDPSTLSATVDYKTGKMTVTAKDGNTFGSTEDGLTVYYQVVKANKTAANNKYTAMAIQDIGDNKGVMNISNLIGKDATLNLSLEANTEIATQVSIVAAPTKVKLEYDASANTIKFKSNSDAYFGTADIASGSAVASNKFITQIRTSAYGEWENITQNSLNDIIQSSQGLGTTVYVRVAKSDNGTTLASPFSKEVKVKIAAKAKAPKLALALNSATKDFELKIAKKLEYKVDFGSTLKSSDWVTGSNSKATWTDIIKEKFPEGKAATIVTGDAITQDMDLLVRTAGTTKKAASAINVIKINKSAASPTASGVTIKYTDPTAKKGSVTTAAIKAGAVDIQYRTDKDSNGKWKTLKKDKEKALAKDVTSVEVRYPGVKNENTLPSLVTTITLDRDTKSGTVAAYDYVGNPGVGEASTATPAVSNVDATNIGNVF